MAGASLDKKKPQKTVMFVGHHSTPNDQLVWPLVEAFRPGRIRLTDAKPVPPEEEAALVKRWTDWPHGFNQARFFYARPVEGKTPSGWDKTEIVIGRPPPKHTDVKGRVAEFPLFAREAGQWYEVVASGDQIDWTSGYEMAWFLDKVLLTLPIYKPDFAFGDLRENVFKNIGDDPRQRAWPLMILGQDIIARLGGRERLLDAPVSKAEELEGGQILLQVGENPFVASAEALARLAQYLALPTR